MSSGVGWYRQSEGMIFLSPFSRTQSRSVPRSWLFLDSDEKQFGAGWLRPTPMATIDRRNTVRGGKKMKKCMHTDQIRNVKPHTHGCEDCLQTGDTWVHLRLCMTCGHVGCCDSSK